MENQIRQFLSNFFNNALNSHLKDENSFSMRKLMVDESPYQQYGLAAAGGTVVSFASILLMALLIATGEVSLDDSNLRKNCRRCHASERPRTN